MTNYYGTGVGRHLTAGDTQFSGLVFQAGKPPIAEEFNLLGAALEGSGQDMQQSRWPSGFLSDPFNPKADYHFDPQASNMFWLGSPDKPLHALVNGWLIPVAGTLWGGDLRNAIKLPKPMGEAIFVFLEVWKAQISPDGTLNKPAEDEVFRYGNVEFGGANLPNQILDPRFMIETTERHQIQYRIRVVPGAGVDPAQFPYGFHDQIRAQGPKNTPVPGHPFENMGDTLGDPGLWRAGIPHDISADGTLVNNLSPLGTVDGYVYAIPICFVSRRAKGTWNINQHTQSVDRNPGQANRFGARVLPIARISGDVPAPPSTGSSTATIATDTPINDTTFPPSGLLRLGDEIIAYASWVGQTITVSTNGRGARGTHPSSHKDATPIRWVSGHPLNWFADQVVAEDVLDLRHVINLSGAGSHDLLRHNFHKLISGALQTSWKRSDGGGGGLLGCLHFQADQFSAASSGSGILHRDRPDGFRRIFSDAAARQPGNMLVVHANGSPAGYTLNLAGAQVFRDTNTPNWIAGDSITLPLAPLRNTFNEASPGNQKVRFVHPYEYRGVPEHDPVVVWDTDPLSPKSAKTLNFTVLGKKPEGINPVYLSGSGSSLVCQGNEIQVVNGGVALDFSPAIARIIEQGGWIYIPKGSGGPFGGAFRVVGVNGGSGALVVEDAKGGNPAFPTITTTKSWQILSEACTEEDDHVAIILQEDLQSTANIYIVYDVLYHPGQGMARVPTRGLFARLETGLGTYVRQNTYADLSSVTPGPLKDFALAPMETMPQDRGLTPRTRNNQDMRTNVESTWAEAYLDRGSKTFLFQPLQRATVPCAPAPNPTLPYAAGPGAAAYDFNLTAGQPSYLVPAMAGVTLPPAGRVDAPFVRSSTNPQHAYGINLCLHHADNPHVVHPHVLGIYDPATVTSYGSYTNLTSVSVSPSFQGNALVCRIYDKGGVRGIELPEHFGVARLYGVYEKADALSLGSAFVGPDYVNKVTGGQHAHNLLRSDVMARSMVISPGGGGGTFVIPEDALDIQHLGKDLSELELVFEFAGFMFEDWGADFVRLHTRVSSAGGSGADLQMYINGPAKAGDAVTVITTRTPYQGNITGSMPLSTNDPATLGLLDYKPKRGPDKATTLQNIGEPLDARAARVENPAHLEILAILPFATTLGTGRISGEFFPGGYTDTGYISQRGFPAAGPSGRRHVACRAIDSAAYKGVVLPDMFTGMTERLPLGAYAADHLFLGEGMYGEMRLFWEPANIVGASNTHAHYQDNQPLGQPLGAGRVVLSDGTAGGNSPGGSPVFNAADGLYRTYRGGVLTTGGLDSAGGAFIVGGDKVYKEFPELTGFDAAYAKMVASKNDLLADLIANVITQPEYDEALQAWGQELNELRDTFQKRMQVHGAVLFGLAMLVRTQAEVAAQTPSSPAGVPMNYGGELQMLVATGASFGADKALDPFNDNARETLDLLIQMHPTGLGEGWGAADRYRIEGRPLVIPSQPAEDFEVYRGTKPLGPLTNNGCGCP